MTTTIKIVNFTGAMHECEYCGSHSSERTTIFVNDEEVWQKYDDGHMHSSISERSLVDCILEAWNKQQNSYIEQEYTETRRIAWNKRHPGNSIAATPENWLEAKDRVLGSQLEYLEQVKQDCNHLPYEIELQVKMIALWIENACGEKIVIEIEGEFE